MFATEGSTETEMETIAFSLHKTPIFANNSCFNRVTWLEVVDGATSIQFAQNLILPFSGLHPPGIQVFSKFNNTEVLVLPPTPTSKFRFGQLYPYFSLTFLQNSCT